MQPCQVSRKAWYLLLLQAKPSLVTQPIWCCRRRVDPAAPQFVLRAELSETLEIPPWWWSSAEPGEHCRQVLPVKSHWKTASTTMEAIWEKAQCGIEGWLAPGLSLASAISGCLWKAYSRQGVDYIICPGPQRSCLQSVWNRGCVWPPHWTSRWGCAPGESLKLLGTREYVWAPQHSGQRDTFNSGVVLPLLFLPDTE